MNTDKYIALECLKLAISSGVNWEGKNAPLDDLIIRQKAEAYYKFVNELVAHEGGSHD